MASSTRYVASRLVQALITLVLVALVVFVLTTMIGDPVGQLLPKPFTAEQYDRVRHELGYDRPLLEQFGSFVSSAVSGDFGESATHQIPATSVVLSRLPVTLQLAVPAFAVALIIGVPLGFLAAYHPNTMLDRIATTLATIGQSAPSFVISILLIHVFAVRLNLFPASGSGGGVHLVLPVCALAVSSMGAVVRLARSGMREVLNRPFVLMVRSRGLGDGQMMVRHGARNAILPLFTFSGLEFSQLLMGSVVVETIFGIGGVGSLAVESVEQRDRAVILTVVMYGAVLFIMVNLITDICYSWIDPQIRLGQR